MEKNKKQDLLKALKIFRREESFNLKSLPLEQHYMGLNRIKVQTHPYPEMT